MNRKNKTTEDEFSEALMTVILQISNFSEEEESQIEEIAKAVGEGLIELPKRVPLFNIMSLEKGLVRFANFAELIKKSFIQKRKEGE